MEYEALLFITEIPDDVTDDDLQKLLNVRINSLEAHGCVEILIRADINATSNEIWEQFKGLNADMGKAKVVEFSKIE